MTSMNMAGSLRSGDRSASGRTAVVRRHSARYASAVHRIAVIALDSVVAFDLSIPAQIFGHRDERDRYRLAVCAERPGPVPTSTGFAIVAGHGLATLRRADTVIVPGFERTEAPVPPAVVKALQAADRRGARIVSICTGAFALAAAGLLDGRRATTHWRHAAELRARHPEIDLDPGVLYVDDGRILTSAGVAAGIDLCLHLVARDHGTAAANAIARRMVVAPHRGGGQAQFVERAVPERSDDGLGATRAWMLERLERPLSVTEMARHAVRSERSFARHFRAETGSTPLRWLHEQRILHARRLLEETDMPVEDIAASSGFGTATTLRQHFRRATRTTPTAYRQAFNAAAR
jgi:transcriptional regulator GlxA family with amidase domain